MANVSIKFNNKDYLLSCDDGQEESLKSLTKFLDKKYSELKDKLGNIGENKLLLITTIQLIDDYFDLKQRVSQQKEKIDDLANKFQELKRLAIRYKEGKDLTLIATGGILSEAYIVWEELKKLGLEVKLVGMHSIKPIDIDEIKDSVENTGGIVTIEEHNKDGGLGSAVSEVCMDLKMIPKKFLRIGLDNKFSSIVGTQQYLRSRYEIDNKTIVKKVIDMIN